MGLPFTNSHLVVPHPALYSAPGSLPLVWPLAPCTCRAVCRVRCSPKGPKLGFEYLPTYKICIACTAFPLSPSGLNNTRRWVVIYPARYP